MKAKSKTLIIGCGYVGLPLALHLQAKGDAIDAWVRSGASAKELAGHAFSKIIAGSVADAEAWRQLGQNYDRVIHCAASGGGGVAAYEEVFLHGVEMMNAHQPRSRRLFVSSTSVYGQTGGEVVTEESAANPATDTGRILREAEKAALEGGVTVVRSSGIYGPNRAMLLEKFRRGDAVIEGDGTRWINQIHQRDLMAALAHLLDAGEPGKIYNACDDSPVMTLDYYAWCSDFLAKPPPPYGPVNVNRKRGLSNKRVSNAKLRATGWTPLYPSFKEGLVTDNLPEHPL